MAHRTYVPRHATVATTAPEPKVGARRAARATTAVVAVLGATAVATAVATPAHAISRSTVWDRVARCESSGNWHINTGNGFYGGLQFTASTWAGFGGHRFAPQANRATRVQQIAVARRVLAVQGPRAWPVCGPRAGLTRRAGLA
jgi:resuscitation-promoting factor RpfA